MKTIIYLDQNYVSWLTKARLGVKVNLAPYYDNLYDSLREAVEANTVVCPASGFHYSESELDTRLAPEIHRTLEELYCGVELLSFTQIIQAQVANALRDFLGVERLAQPNEAEAFNRDPHQTCDGTMEPVHYLGSGIFRELSRNVKAYHGQQREPAPVGSLQDQKRFEAEQYISWLYYLPALSFARGGTDIFTWAGLDLPASLMHIYSELLGREPTAEEIAVFLDSEEMMAAPFIDVYSSLRAGMIVWSQQRKPKGSDLNDVLIAATVLPYCDVFATDGYMKQLTLALKLDKRYGVTVFGSRKADVLALTSLVRDLASGEAPGSPPQGSGRVNRRCPSLQAGVMSSARPRSRRHQLRSCRASALPNLVATGGSERLQLQRLVARSATPTQQRRPSGFPDRAVRPTTARPRADPPSPSLRAPPPRCTRPTV